MKKRISGLGIFVMLLVKHPPLPDFALFSKTPVTEVRGMSLKQIALDFFLN